jgi:hypothetical protein
VTPFQKVSIRLIGFFTEAAKSTAKSKIVLPTRLGSVTTYISMSNVTSAAVGVK